eukprot:scaffold232167_cov30-Tisochrysis_lutea.AAC.2
MTRPSAPPAASPSPDPLAQEEPVAVWVECACCKKRIYRVLLAGQCLRECRDCFGIAAERVEALATAKVNGRAIARGTKQAIIDEERTVVQGQCGKDLGDFVEQEVNLVERTSL